MSRMDKYDDIKKEEVVFSRTQKNQDMYKDVYLNNTFVDYGDVKIEKETVSPKEEEVSVVYEEKNYDVNEYIRKAHENRINDNLKRSLDNTDCEVCLVSEKEDEISKLIKSIEEKEQEFETEFFSDLLPDENQVTAIESSGETKLEKVIDEKKMEDYHEDIVDDGRDDFKDVYDKKIKKLDKKTPIIVFSVTSCLLVVVIILIFTVV